VVPVVTFSILPPAGICAKTILQINKSKIEIAILNVNGFFIGL
jgi:hypothetical protein